MKFSTLLRPIFKTYFKNVAPERTQKIIHDWPGKPLSKDLRSLTANKIIMEGGDSAQAPGIWRPHGSVPRLTVSRADQNSNSMNVG